MRLRTESVPFVITVLAMPLNWVVGFSGVGIATWLPELLAIWLFVLFAWTGRLSANFSAGQLFLAGALFFQLFAQAILGIGLGSSGVASVVLTTLLFYAFLRSARDSNALARQVVRQLSFIYMVHVGFVAFEALLLSSGQVGLLSRLSGGNYKPGLDLYAQTPQSLSMQSQAASQFCVLAMVWFLMLYLSRRRLETPFTIPYAAALGLGSLLAVLYPTTTMAVVGVVLLAPVALRSPYAKSWTLRITLVVAALMLYRPLAATIADKTALSLPGVAASFEPMRALEYQRAFGNPLTVFDHLSTGKRLFGAGMFQSDPAFAGIQTDADLGIAITLLQIGLVVGALLMLTMLWPVWRAYRLNRRAKAVTGSWGWLSYVNGLLVLGNFLSLFHYTVSLQVGGRTLLALHLAVLMLSLEHVRRFSPVPSTALLAR